MRVGILTLHYGANYGGVLQAAALQETVSELGHKAEVLDYVPAGFRPLRLWRGWGLGNPSRQRMVNRALQVRYRGAIMRAFDRFRRERLCLSKRARTESELAGFINDYEVILVGSDQVWNLDRKGPYWLPRSLGFRGRRATYAACSVTDYLRHPPSAEKIRNIQEFDFITVRDEHTQALVRQAAGVHSHLVCDPVMLREPAWPIKLPLRPRRDILFYGLGEADTQLVQRIKCMYSDHAPGAQVKAIVSVVFNPKRCEFADSVSYTTGPLHWCEAIGSAGLVVTDSFHAVLFCIKYRTPFLIRVTEGERSGRIKSLAARFGLEHHMITDSSELAPRLAALLKTPIDYFPRFEAHISESRARLRQAITG
jgi:hypothetical protein